MYGKEAVRMRRAVLAVGVLGAVVYLKLCLPGFAEEFVPLLRGWLALEQISIPISAEAMAWLLSG